MLTVTFYYVFFVLDLIFVLFDICLLDYDILNVEKLFRICVW